jgi:nucleotide-binding universal stress UspA family protein
MNVGAGCAMSGRRYQFNLSRCAHSALTLRADHACIDNTIFRRDDIMYSHILVAVGPSFSEAALSVAIAKARQTKARLTVLHVIDESPWWAGSFADGLCNSYAMVNQLALAVRDHTGKMVAEAGMDADWQTRSLPADGRSVARVIAEAAYRLNADLVVLGAHRRGLRALGVHRVRDAVCRRASCEVLIAVERAPSEARVIDMAEARQGAADAQSSIVPCTPCSPRFQ